MATKFRKSVKLGGGVKLNLNKKSVGISVGVKGARISVNSSGRKTVTTGIPGTGLYNTTTISGSKHNGDVDELPCAQSPASNDSPVYAFIITFLGIVLICMSALLIIVVPPAGIIGVIFGALCVYYGRRIKKRIRKAKADLAQNLTKQ